MCRMEFTGFYFELMPVNGTGAEDAVNVSGLGAIGSGTAWEFMEACPTSTDEWVATDHAAPYTPWDHLSMCALSGHASDH